MQTIKINGTKRDEGNESRILVLSRINMLAPRIFLKIEHRPKPYKADTVIIMEPMTM